jgi:hypothetical protein
MCELLMHTGQCSIGFFCGNSSWEIVCFPKAGIRKLFWMLNLQVQVNLKNKDARINKIDFYWWIGFIPTVTFRAKWRWSKTFMLCHVKIILKETRVQWPCKSWQKKHHQTKLLGFMFPSIIVCDTPFCMFRVPKF